MTENYTIYKIDEIDYYKCINCDYNTKYLWSINRHSINEFKDENEKLLNDN